jgi:hypothetical protein
MRDGHAKSLKRTIYERQLAKLHVELGSPAAIATNLARQPVPPRETLGRRPRHSVILDTSSADASDTGEPLTISAAEHLGRLACCSNKLSELLPSHRRTTLDSVASGNLTAIRCRRAC